MVGVLVGMEAMRYEDFVMARGHCDWCKKVRDLVEIDDVKLCRECLRADNEGTWLKDAILILILVVVSGLVGAILHYL